MENIKVDVEEVAALGRLGEFQRRGVDVVDHVSITLDIGIGPGSHGGVRATSILAIRTAGDVAVVVEVLVRYDALLGGARI